MGSRLKPPKAPPFILNSHFHQVFLFIQNKEVKTKWHFNRTARKAPARNYQHFPLSLWKQQHGPSEHRHYSLPGSHWVSFDRHGERSDFDEEMFPLCASVQRRLNPTECWCARMCGARVWACTDWCTCLFKLGPVMNDARLFICIFWWFHPSEK